MERQAEGTDLITKILIRNVTEKDVEETKDGAHGIGRLEAWWRARWDHWWRQDHLHPVSQPAQPPR